MVGDAGVGKSSLLLRYTDDKFSHDIVPTVGLDFRVKVRILETVTGIYTLLFFIGDRAQGILSQVVNLGHCRCEEHQCIIICLTLSPGQERFQNISSAYYRGAQGVLLVYDVTSRKSLDRLDTWLGEVARHEEGDRGASMVRMVVGTKSDQLARRVITRDMGARWAADRGLTFTGRDHGSRI